MKEKKILVIMGHPSIESLNCEVADSYVEGAKKNFEVRTLYLPKLKFDPILHEGYNKIQKLEKDLIEAQKLILWADHLVFVYPIWWTSFPAILKGFIDRTFLPGFAFKYEKNGKRQRLLRGRTASLIMTAGGPRLWYFLFGKIMNRAMTIGLLNFCGIKYKKQKFICGIRKGLSEERFNEIISDVFSWGQKGI